MLLVCLPGAWVLLTPACNYGFAGDVDVNFEAYLENGDVKSVEVSVPAADFFVTKVAWRVCSAAGSMHLLFCVTLPHLSTQHQHTHMFAATQTLMYSAIPYLHGWPQGLSTGGVEYVLWCGCLCFRVVAVRPDFPPANTLTPTHRVHAAYMHQPQGGNYDGMDLS